MKGAYYTIEAIIAVLLVTSIFLVLFLQAPENPEIERTNIKTQVYNGLDNLNARGSLREQMLNNNATGIKNDLDDFLPVFVSLNVAIYNKTFQNLTAEFTEQVTDVVAVSYYVAGDVGNYTPKEVRVHVWGFG